MSRSYLNLARDPFVNARPVVRLSIVLWVVGALLLAGNVWLYWDFLAGRGDTYSRLQAVEEEIVTTRQRIASLESELESFDLAAQNDQVQYLNARIDRRRFAWSRLFDALAEILPDDVRLTRLSPSERDEAERGTIRAASAGRVSDEKQVLLRIDAVARNDESILTMVDTLFGEPAFEHPTLLQQRRRDNGLIDFDVETIYTPSEVPEDGESPDPAPPESPDDEPPPDDEPSPATRSARTKPNRAARLGAPASSAPEVR